MLSSCSSGLHSPSLVAAPSTTATTVGSMARCGDRSSSYQPSVNEPGGYLDSLQGERWNGSVASTSDLDLRKGGVVLYDISSTDSAAKLSVFIAPGPRPDVPTDDGQHYNGPSQVFTCYRVEATFSSVVAPSVGRVTFDDCSAALVELMPEGAVFASGEVFDG